MQCAIPQDRLKSKKLFPVWMQGTDRQLRPEWKKITNIFWNEGDLDFIGLWMFTILSDWTVDTFIYEGQQCVCVINICSDTRRSDSNRLWPRVSLWRTSLGEILLNARQLWDQELIGNKWESSIKTRQRWISQSFLMNNVMKWIKHSPAWLNETDSASEVGHSFRTSNWWCQTHSIASVFQNESFESGVSKPVEPLSCRV